MKLIMIVLASVLVLSQATLCQPLLSKQNKVKPVQKGERPSAQKELLEDIFMAYEESLLARQELNNAENEISYNLADENVAPYARRQQLAEAKVNLLVARYQKKYNAKFDVQKEYMSRRYGKH